MKKYFLHNGTEQQGPFDIEELKSKNLTRDTPIWFDGLSEWTTIGAVEELKHIVVIIPPPFAAAKPATPPPPVQQPVRETNVSIEKPKQGSATGKRILIAACIIVLGLLAVFINNQIQHQKYENLVDSEEARKNEIRNNITSYVTAERSAYQYNELGGIYDLSISVSNNTDYLLDKVTVRVIYIKANGDVWNSRNIDFSLVNPQTKSTIKVPDTERGTSINYEIVSIKSAVLGLN